MRFCRYDHSEQRFILVLLLKMRSYLSGSRIIFGKMSGYLPTRHTFEKDFLGFRKNGLYLTQKMFGKVIGIEKTLKKKYG